MAGVNIVRFGSVSHDDARYLSQADAASTLSQIITDSDSAAHDAMVQTATDAANVAAAGKVDKGEIVLNAQDFGIVGDGSTQDLTALNAALASISGSVSVYFPPPANRYRFDTPLVERDNVTFYGDGSDTIIGWHSSSMFNPTGAVSGWVLRDLTADLSGSGAHLIDLTGGGGMSNCEFNRVQFRTYIDDGSVIRLDGSGNFIGNRFYSCIVRRRDTATVPAIHITTTASGVNSLKVDGGTWFSNGVTNSPMILIENTSGSSYCNNMSFANMTGEQSAGGLIHMNAANGITLRNVVDYDQSTYSDDLFKFGKGGSNNSQAIDMDNCGTAGTASFPAGCHHLTIDGAGSSHRVGRVFGGARMGSMSIPDYGRAVVNNGGPALSLRSVVGNRTLDTYDHVILASQTGTITLPDPTADVNGGTLPVGREYIIKNVGTATTTVNCDGSATINGSASLTLAAGDVCRAITNGSDWVTI